MSRFIAALLLAFIAGVAGGQVTLTEGTNISVHAARDGRLAIDLLGGVWIIPSGGGVASAVETGPLPARRPRWSPTADTIVYQVRTANQDQLWLYEFASDVARNVSDGQFFDQHPDWHPSGERIVFSSDRRDSGFDLWELDLQTNLTWRVSHLAGDETEPAWSADGRHLVYVHRDSDQWSIMLRRHGQPDEVLETAKTRLSVPAWRPDGSLITYLRHGVGGLSIDMVILSDPPLNRPMITDEDLFVSPVTWLDRQELLYTANGLIRRRNINSWTSSTLPFRVTAQRKAAQRSPTRRRRELPSFATPSGRLVIRAARLYEGTGDDYRLNRDIVIDGGRIVAVEERRERPGAIVVDMGDLTALPGFIDGYAALPADADATLGPLLLSFGVTTIIADHEDAAALNEVWSGKDMPGPRVLGRGWQLDLDTTSTIMLGMNSLPASPRGIRYMDLQIGAGTGPTTILSGLADARTQGLGSLLHSRQAGLLQRYPSALRRFTEKPELAAAAASIVLGSRPNGLPPGIAQQAELLALADAELAGAQILRAAGVNAAAALGLGTKLGHIAPGGVADIVLVDGDPLTAIGDAQKVVGVVRNGRFFSAIGLIERAQSADAVE